MNLIPFNFTLDNTPEQSEHDMRAGEETARSVRVRVVDLDGDTYFVGVDVAYALGYADPTTAIRSHCRGVQKLHPIPDALGRMQETRLLGESDVLRLIVSSNLPAAQRFERWVFEDVLPSIRKTGRYAAPQFPVPQSLPEALRLAADLAEKNTALVAQVAEQATTVVAFERIADSSGAMCLTSAAKHLQVRPRLFTEQLRARGWIYKRGGVWVGNAYPTDRGYLLHKVVTYARDTDGDHTSEQVLVTAQGIAVLAKLFAKESAALNAMSACKQVLG